MGPSPSQERVLIQQAYASEASCCGIEAHRTRKTTIVSKQRLSLAKIFIDNNNERRMLSQEVVDLSDKTNVLMNRREIIVLFKEQAGKLRRIEASEIVAKKFGLNKNCVVPINMRSERGKKNFIGTFYAFNTEEEIKSQVPRYRLLRNLSKEERKKLINEEKAAKLKAKQASSETKG
jgi:small subunit ribosomal protein S24e